MRAIHHHPKTNSYNVEEIKIIFENSLTNNGDFVGMCHLFKFASMIVDCENFVYFSDI